MIDVHRVHNNLRRNMKPAKEQNYDRYVRNDADKKQRN